MDTNITIVQSQNGKALSSSFLKASKMAMLAIKRMKPPTKENTADIINRLRTIKPKETMFTHLSKFQNFSGYIIYCYISNVLTIPISDVNKIECDDVVSGMLTSWHRFVQTIDVKCGS